MYILITCLLYKSNKSQQKVNNESTISHEKVIFMLHVY